MSAKKIGILALQGCVDPHKNHLRALGADCVDVRRPEDFKNIDGLILPGGESSTMLKLIDHFDIFKCLIETAKKIPYWGICAGSILMAKKVTNPAQKSLGLLNIEIQRNAYGRQLDSHNVLLEYLALKGKKANYEVSFIRAPIITKVSQGCEVLAIHQAKAVWVREGHHFVSTFHSELNPQFPSPFHKTFLDHC